VPDNQYRYREDTLARLHANGVRWPMVDYVLNYSRPIWREYLGTALLRIVGYDRDGDLLLVTVLERPDEDDVYDILTARCRPPGRTPAMNQPRDIIEQALAAAAAPFPHPGAKGEIVTDRPPAKSVVSARVDARLEDDLIAEAVRSDRTPSALIADLLDEALAARHVARRAP
jgi:hypothetical protein